MKHHPFPIKQIPTSNIKFDSKGTLSSVHYGDIYAQIGHAIEEKKHVFLTGNDLPNNWSNKNTFNIAETGFGTGLNFINTFHLWSQTKQDHQHLHYIGCELHPLNRMQLQQALSPFTALKKYSQILIEQYPCELLYGFHRLHFKQFNITLTLIFSDCLTGLQQLDATIDAWFLDGFSPPKNPKMWSLELFKTIAHLSRKGTTVATYSAARMVRDNLQAAGFELKKRTGYGKKREMLTATLLQPNLITNKKPWCQTFCAPNQTSYTVLGAGIAGLSIAQKLFQQGKNVTLIDRHSAPFQEASGNRQAIIMPSLMLNDSPEAQFYLSAFLYAIKHYDQRFYHPCGVNQLSTDDKQRLWQNKLLTNFDLPDSLLKQHKNGLIYPQAGWLDTHGHAEHCVKHLKDYIQSNISNIYRENNQWCLKSTEKIVHQTDVLIMANGIHFAHLFSEYDLPIVPKHGQVSYFDSNCVDATDLANLKHVLLNKGYITPNHQGTQLLGATFDHVNKDQWFNKPLPTKDHWKRNCKPWQDTNHYKHLNSIEKNTSRASIRVTTTDHMPICGPLIDQEHFREHYRDIHHGKHWKSYPKPQAIKNLYIFTGLGSRGFTSAPILAEFLCNQILNQPSIINMTLQKHIHPNRFLYKKMMQK